MAPSPRANRSVREAVMASPDSNDDASTKHHGIRPIEGLSYARIAAGRMLLRLRAHRSKKSLLVPLVAVVFLLLFITLSKRVKVSSTKTRTIPRTIPGVPFVQRPIMVQMTNYSVTPLPLPEEYHPLEERENRFWVDHGTSQHKPRSKVKKGCTALAPDWMESFHPSCNSFHEVSMSELVHEDGWELIRLVNNGAYRDVWGIRDYDGQRRVLKTLRYVDNRYFDQRNFDRHRRDAVASEQLSASPYIVDIYGYCSNSALTDYCDGGDLFDVRELQNPDKFDLLQIAHDVAQSVADAHHYDDKGRATIAHTDLKPNQWIYLNGRYKLNDFNRCRFMSWNNERDQVCGFEVARNAGVVSVQSGKPVLHGGLF